jgi:hypothetical protein
METIGTFVILFDSIAEAESDSGDGDGDGDGGRLPQPALTPQLVLRGRRREEFQAKTFSCLRMTYRAAFY